MNGLEITREYFPKLTEDGLGYILWNRTGWPSFFAGDPEACLRGQLAEYREALKRGTDLCTHCNNDALPGEWECAKCHGLLERAATRAVEPTPTPAVEQEEWWPLPRRRQC